MTDEELNRIFKNYDNEYKLFVKELIKEAENNPELVAFRKFEDANKPFTKRDMLRNLFFDYYNKEK